MLNVQLFYFSECITEGYFLFRQRNNGRHKALLYLNTISALLHSDFGWEIVRVYTNQGKSSTHIAADCSQEREKESLLKIMEKKHTQINMVFTLYPSCLHLWHPKLPAQLKNQQSILRSMWIWECFYFSIKMHWISLHFRSLLWKYSHLHIFVKYELDTIGICKLQIYSLESLSEVSLYILNKIYSSCCVFPHEKHLSPAKERKIV